MPELPEVETIRRALRDGGREGPSVLNRTVEGGRLLWTGSLAAPTPRRFWPRLRGRRIRDLGRRGKFLLIELDDLTTLALHLRMSGDVIAEPDQGPLPRFARFVARLSGDVRLVFTDPRKFGRIWLQQDARDLLASLGPEPLDPTLTRRAFTDRVRSRRRQLKPLLLDQSFLAGLGNIYTDEALHAAGLHPRTPADTLTVAQTEALWRSIRRVLRAGIRRHGSSIDWIYRGGDYQSQLRVYGRRGLPCPVCGTEIERLLVGQRGTHICPRCQPPPPNADRGAGTNPGADGSRPRPAVPDRPSAGHGVASRGASR